MWARTRWCWPLGGHGSTAAQQIGGMTLPQRPTHHRRLPERNRRPNRRSLPRLMVSSHDNQIYKAQRSLRRHNVAGKHEAQVGQARRQRLGRRRRSRAAALAGRRALGLPRLICRCRSCRGRLHHVSEIIV